jgi:thiamine pyrophosphokinase
MKTINLIGPLKLQHQEVNFNLPSFFIDGGLKYIELFSNPKESFGDGDSNIQEKRHKIDHKLDKDKSFSDYAYALKSLLNTHIIHLHGLYGQRDDHQLAIIGDTFKLLKNTSNKLIFLHNLKTRPWIFSSYNEYSFNIRGHFSLFTIEKQKIRLLGAKYPLEGSCFELEAFSSHGLSNFAQDMIQINSQSPYLIIPFN